MFIDFFEFDAYWFLWCWCCLEFVRTCRWLVLLAGAVLVCCFWCFVGSVCLVSFWFSGLVTVCLACFAFSVLAVLADGGFGRSCLV